MFTPFINQFSFRLVYKAQTPARNACRATAVAQVDTRNAVARIERRYVRTFHGLTPRIRYENLPVKRSRPARISARDRQSRGAGEVARKRSQEPGARIQESGGFGCARH